MCTFIEVKPDDLDRELTEDEVNETDVCEAVNVADQNSPFADLLRTLASSGGSQQQSGPRREIRDSTPIDGKLYGQDFEELRQECLESGTLFTDPDFPPDDQSLFFSEDVPYGFEWKRPTELVDDPHLFVDGASRFDINQGELGDCWLLAALANLALNKRFLYRVIPKDQSFTEEYAGIFHFKFWQYGEWVDVVIDDYLPTRFGKLMYMHSTTENEFWSALIEKAYAKLNGCYETLKGGTTSEAMVDFTGGCTETFNLKERDCPSNLITILLKAYERCSLKGCSMEPDPNVLEARMDIGLVKGHAYSVTKIVNALIETPRGSGRIPLIRIRNPWGNETEWKGPWADGSGEWQYIPEEEKMNLGLNFENDGEFWMSYKDFMKHWDQLEICNLTPDSLENMDEFENRPKWEVASFKGSWIAGETAGGCRNFLKSFANNPQYRITVEDPDENDDEPLCTVIISLMQKGRRALRADGVDTLTIGFGLYYLRDPSSFEGPLGLDYFQFTKSVGRSKAFINLREVATRFRLPVGTYLILPSTFHPDQEGEFLLRVFTEKAATAEQIQ